MVYSLEINGLPPTSSSLSLIDSNMFSTVLQKSRTTFRPLTLSNTTNSNTLNRNHFNYSGKIISRNLIKSWSLLTLQKKMENAVSFILMMEIIGVLLSPLLILWSNINGNLSKVFNFYNLRMFKTSLLRIISNNFEHSNKHYLVKIYYLQPGINNNTYQKMNSF